MELLLLIKVLLLPLLGIVFWPSALVVLYVFGKKPLVWASFYELCVAETGRPMQLVRPDDGAPILVIWTSPKLLITPVNALDLYVYWELFFDRSFASLDARNLVNAAPKRRPMVGFRSVLELFRLQRGAGAPPKRELSHQTYSCRYSSRSRWRNHQKAVAIVRDCLLHRSAEDVAGDL